MELLGDPTPKQYSGKRYGQPTWKAPSVRSPPPRQYDDTHLNMDWSCAEIHLQNNTPAKDKTKQLGKRRLFGVHLQNSMGTHI